MPTLRLLTVADLDDALELSAGAGWNQTRADWERLLRLQPDGCFAIEREGKVVATATAIRYGAELAWIGMVLTHRGWQRRGFASMLMDKVLDYTADLPCRMLDASAEGQPIYERLGFRGVCGVDRWELIPLRPTSSRLSEVRSGLRGYSDLGGGWDKLDRRAFGADRLALLSTFVDPVGSPGAYAYSRTGSLARYFGPCVADNPTAAEVVLRACLDDHPGERWFWDLLPDNDDAVRLATRYGFGPVRRLVRMYNGTPPFQEPLLTYAIAGFELG